MGQRMVFAWLPLVGGTEPVRLTAIRHKLYTLAIGTWGNQGLSKIVRTICEPSLARPTLSGGANVIIAHGRKSRETVGAKDQKDERRLGPGR